MFVCVKLRVGVCACVYEHIEQAHEKGEILQGMSVRVCASFCTHYSESGRGWMCARVCVLVCERVREDLCVCVCALKKTSCKFIPVRLGTLPSAALPTSMSSEALLAMQSLPKIWREDSLFVPPKKTKTFLLTFERSGLAVDLRGCLCQEHRNSGAFDSRGRMPLNSPVAVLEKQRQASTSDSYIAPP